MKNINIFKKVKLTLKKVNLTFPKVSLTFSQVSQASKGLNCYFYLQIKILGTQDDIRMVKDGYSPITN